MTGSPCFIDNYSYYGILSEDNVNNTKMTSKVVRGTKWRQRCVCIDDTPRNKCLPCSSSSVYSTSSLPGFSLLIQARSHHHHHLTLTLTLSNLLLQYSHTHTTLTLTFTLTVTPSLTCCRGGFTLTPRLHSPSHSHSPPL